MTGQKDFPESFSGPLAWSVEDLDSYPEKSRIQLTVQEVEEIKTATKHFLSLGLPRGFVSRKTFRLSDELSKRLEYITSLIYEGPGFCVLRGFDPSDSTPEELVITFAGIASYVASMRVSSIDHIRDRTFSNPRNEDLRPNELRVPMGFHTDVDQPDILSLFTVSKPIEGGIQQLSSIETIYNELLKDDRDVLQTLKENWYWEVQVQGMNSVADIATYRRPIIGMGAGHLQVNVSGAPLGVDPKYQLSPAAPQVSVAQRHALQMLQNVAKRTSVRISPNAGDILFVNNFAVMHARESWLDSKDDLSKTRHLMRLWLHDFEKGWESSPALQRDHRRGLDLAPESQKLLTSEEWDEIPRPFRIKPTGAVTNNHD